jgi:ABC-type nitrate/sulfonate/bicarbonate transport system substrate-binding protein
MQTLRIGYFSRSPVLAVAESRGVLARHGLRLETEAVASSPAQYRSIASGDYDLVLTSPDNVVAYRVGTANPLHERIPTRIVLAGDGGLGLVVTARAGVGIEDLAGGTVGVDVTGSGFAFALYAYLAAQGLRRDQYTLVELGSTPRRASALAEGRCDATLLNGGFPVRAVLAGARAIGRISDVVAPYLGTVVATTDAWAAEHGDELGRFRAAWLEAVAILLDPAEHDALAPLVADVFGVPRTEVGTMRRVLENATEGLVPDGTVDPAALEAVLRLRREHADPDAARAAGDAEDARIDRLVDPAVLRAPSA